jgi:hypothetical protein
MKCEFGSSGKKSVVHIKWRSNLPKKRNHARESLFFKELQNEAKNSRKKKEGKRKANKVLKIPIHVKKHLFRRS